MSLDTILKIGKALRNSNESLKNFKYVSPCPKEKDGKYIEHCFSIPVLEDYSIYWNKIRLLHENEKSELFYLRFKTSDSDSLVKYIFGDIFYSQTAKVKKDGSIEKGEGGYFRLPNPSHSTKSYQRGSFERGQSDFEKILKGHDGEVLRGFRSNLESDLDILEDILSNISAVEEYVFENLEGDFTTFLNDENALSKATIRRVFEKTSTQNKKKLGIENELSELTKEEKLKLLSFDHGDIYIHFEFPDDKHWYQFENEFTLIVDQMLADFVENSEEGLVLKKTLYKTLCSGDKKNDWQFPLFQVENKYKSKAFTDDEMRDLFYALDFSSKGKTILGTDIKVIILPKGDNLEAEHFDEFIRKRYDEKLIKELNESGSEDEEPTFENFEKEDESNITSFDVVFCKIGGSSSPDVDLLEISGIEKSKIQIIRKRLEDIAKEVAKKRKAFLKTDKELFGFKIEYSLQSILGNPQFDQKTNKVSIKANLKYQSHILKVLPKIYTENYHHDEVLLPAFLRNVEYSIRSGDNKFNLLKFDLEFLIRIQNSPTNKFEIMINTKSYQLGYKLGQLAKPLRKAINSFEKSYVGLITRRVATKDDCVKFTNEILEKLTRNNKRWAEQTAIVVAELAAIPLNDYDKELVAFGFLGGYFTYEEDASNTKKFYSKLEKLLNDFGENEELQPIIENISNITNSAIAE